MKNKIKLKNGRKLISRYFLAPINLGNANNGCPTNETIRFFSERSGKKIGITYIGNVAIGSEYCTNKSTLYFGNNYTKWNELISSLDKNSMPAIQLGCKHSTIKGMRQFFNHNPQKYINDAKEEILNISESEINSIIKSFGRSSDIARKLGFELLQIHAAHGYFISLMLSPTFNKRKDEYGEDRTLILKRIIEEIKSRNPELMLDVRLSLYEGLKDRDIEFKVTENIIKQIHNMEIDFISISSGIYNINKYDIYPKKEKGYAPYLNKTIKLSNDFREVYWNVAGNIWDIQELDNENQNITYSIGRSLIADPKFIEKQYFKTYNSIKVCKRCGMCHYYSKSEKSIFCSQNSIYNK